MTPRLDNPLANMRSASRPVAAVLLLSCAALVPACYERVVSSKGMGARQEEGSYRSDTFLDRAYDDLTGSSAKPPPPKTKVGAFKAR